MNQIDAFVRALAKSVLIDIELHQYCMVKIVAGLISASYEILKKT